MTKTIAIAIGLLCVSSAAFAQLPDPECARLPNGGKLEIDIPGVTVMPACQACARGFAVPANFVLGFSNGHHDTCELKKPNGDNSGLCRADTVCAPGTTRTYQDNTLWVCQSAGTKKVIDCPVPPGAGGTGRPPSPGSVPDARLMACATKLSSAEARLVDLERRANSLLKDAAPPRPQIALASFTTAGTMIYELVIRPIINILKTMLITAFREAAESATRQAVACAVGSPAPACVTARDTVKRAADLGRAGAGAWSDATRKVRDQVNVIIEKGTPALKQVATAVQNEVDSVSAEIAACVGDLKRVER